MYLISVFIILNKKLICKYITTNVTFALHKPEKANIIRFLYYKGNSFL